MKHFWMVSILIIVILGCVGFCLYLWFEDSRRSAAWDARKRETPGLNDQTSMREPDPTTPRQTMVVPEPGDRSAAEAEEAPDPVPRQGGKGRFTARSEGEDVIVVKNPEPLFGAADSKRLEFNDHCCVEAVTFVVVGFLGEDDILVRAVAVDGTAPLTDEEQPCARCPAGTLFLVDRASWPQYARDQLDHETEQKTLEAEKEQIRRLLRQEKRHTAERE